jgi:Fur family transcriptional regulator, iron response regulator
LSSRPGHIYLLMKRRHPIQERPFSAALEKLRQAGLRPTRQRLALVRLLFDAGNRHVTAEQLHAEAKSAGISVSLATIYNTLHRFCRAGLLRDVVVAAGRSSFDTNTLEHHHFYFEDTGLLQDIAAEGVSVAGLPISPPGTSVRRVDVIVRIESSKK